MLSGVKNAVPQHETPEMEIQKMSFLWVCTKNDDLF